MSISSYKDAQIQISDYTTSGKKDKATQSPNTKRKLPPEAPEERTLRSDEVYKVKHVQDEFAFNHFCPPALHYNSKNESLLDNNTNQHMSNSTGKNTAVAMVLNQSLFISKRIEYLSDAAAQYCEEEDTNESDRINNEENVEDEENRYLIQKRSSAGPSKPLGHLSFEQMPLLKCLFDEMSKLKNLIENKSTPPNNAQVKVQPHKMIQAENASKQSPKQSSPLMIVPKVNSQNSSQLVGILRKTKSKSNLKGRRRFKVFIEEISEIAHIYHP